MLERLIPSSGERLPAIGLGTWRAFDPPRINESTLAPIEGAVAAFTKAGGRVIDTSPMYGSAQTIAGRVTLKLGVNQDLFIATKVWTSGREAGVRQMEESMRLLGRTRLDLMQIHNLLDWRTHLPTLRAWKDEGRIRYIGITHYEPAAYPSLEEVLLQEQVDFVQLAYSATVRAAADRILPLAAERGVAVLVNRPFDGGALFAHVERRPLPPFLQGFGSTWPEVLLKFVLAHPAVTCTIPATATAEHMAANLSGGEGRLPTERECQRLVEFLEG